MNPAWLYSHPPYHQIIFLELTDHRLEQAIEKAQKAEAGGRARRAQRERFDVFFFFYSPDSNMVVHHEQMRFWFILHSENMGRHLINPGRMHSEPTSFVAVRQIIPGDKHGNFWTEDHSRETLEVLFTFFCFFSNTWGYVGNRNKTQLPSGKRLQKTMERSTSL